MTDVNEQLDWNRPLTTELDLSPQSVPLYWAEGGQVVRVSGTRIALDNIITRFRQGYTPQMIGESYPAVPLPDIFLVISYYLRNKEAVHTYLCEREERAEEITAKAFTDGLMTKEDWQTWCAGKPDRLRWASGQ